MKHLLSILRKHRPLSSRLGGLLLLFQRTPIVQFLLPEAKVLGTVGLGDFTGWTVATIAGLGAFDSVAGASAVTQISPVRGSTTVPAAKGSALTFVFQAIGTEEAAGSWEVIGKLPTGLVHRNVTNSSVDSISGVPGQTGSFPITIRAWEKPNHAGESLTKNFIINVGSAIIIRQPASIAIPAGTSTTLSVGASGTGLAYQWFMGKSPSTAKPIAKGTAATFKTPKLTKTTSYWVRITRAGAIANSKTATVSITTATKED